MVNTKDNPMITGSILHHKIIEELGEVPQLPTSVAPRVVATLSERTPSERILLLFSWSGNQLEELL